MKVIISHDIDHITVFEHKKDLIIPKFILRSSAELLFGSVSKREYYYRFKEFLRNKWNNIEELMDFDEKKNIPSTFFIGVSNGLGLSYSLDHSEYWIKKIIKCGFDVGIHGIAYDDIDEMKREFSIFREISGLDYFGIRMHYLRHNDKTYTYLAEIGYLFDSSRYILENPYRIGNMWEFPLHIMDGYIIYDGKRYQRDKIDKIIKRTKNRLSELANLNLKYISILFHDRYFSDSFLSWKLWYINLIDYLRENGFYFISYKDAIKELEKRKSIVN